jgi:quercetin dioxygenase-like cupin family protein
MLLGTDRQRYLFDNRGLRVLSIIEAMRRHILARQVVQVLLFLSGIAAAQTQGLESCKPVSERTGSDGCWILASHPLGILPDRPIFWTLDVYPDHETAQAAAKSGSTVLDALGKVWLLTVGDKPVQPAKGTRITQIGPLPLKPNESYTAQYRESIMRPGAVSRTHLHSGPEAFYTETGETCLETPSGMQVSRNGHDVVIPEGEPMELVATGTENRTGIVLVLHSSSKPHTTVVTNWRSSGLCKKQK